ncbi:MAG TPA: metal ABC transporter ATP-binding protein [Anaerolineales bacterium]|nr:metal ABC transporter ATP-binding protein [Anaerolineales bacterium]
MALPNELHRTRNLLRGYHTPHQEDVPGLRISNLIARYESAVVLDDVTFSLASGARLAVVGPNGAGKSTLFRVIAGIHSNYEGSVEIFGNNPGNHTCIAYLPQRSQVDWSFPVTVGDVVMMGRTVKMGLFRRPRKEDHSFVRASLEAVGIPHLYGERISDLSGGQQQRMFIARALAQEAELILMDEPMSGLDIQSMEGIFKIYAGLKERGVTVIVSMHDLDLAAEQFDQVLLLNRRLVGIGAPESVFTTENLQRAYGSHLQMIDTDGGLLILSDTCCDDEPPAGGAVAD